MAFRMQFVSGKSAT